MSDITIQVKLPNKNDKMNVVINTNDTVLQAKEKIAVVSGTPAAQQRLIFAGKVLKDNQIISECKIMDNMTVHMVPSASGSTTTPKTPSSPSVSQNNNSSQSSTPSTNASPSPNPSPSPNQNANPSPNANPAPNPFAQNLFGQNPLGGNLFGGLFGNQNQNQNQMFQQMQQSLLSNPQLMQQMMQNPFVQQLNQQILNNPEILRDMIRSNPAMNQILERNPEISHLLNDPALLRQAMEMSQNPELFREVMRSNDRAIANIENIPGGYSYLARQFEDLIEPLQNAAIPPEPQQNQPQQNTTPPSPNPTNNPLPNPWASPNNNGQQANNNFGNNFGFGMPPLDPNLMAQMMGSMFGAQNNQQNPQNNAPQNNAPQNNQQNPFSFLSQMMGNGGFGGFGGLNPQPYTPPANLQNMSPEARYAVQLQQLNDMGFVDQEKNIRCLIATAGNVNSAIERLLSGDI